MAGGAREEPGAWQVHGHLLANVDCDDSGRGGRGEV
jgi:hypothetical protein